MKTISFKAILFFFTSLAAFNSVNSQSVKTFTETFPGKEYKIKIILQDDLSINYCFTNDIDYRGVVGFIVELDKCLIPKSYEKTYLLVFDKQSNKRVYAEFSGSVQVKKVLPDSTFTDRLLKLTNTIEYELVGPKEQFISERISFFFYFDIVCE